MSGDDDDDDFSESEPVEIKAGEEWLTVNCRQCRKTVLIEPVSPDMLDEDGVLVPPESSLEAKCPYCKSEYVYQSDEIQVQAGQQRH